MVTLSGRSWLCSWSLSTHGRITTRTWRLSFWSLFCFENIAVNLVILLFWDTVRYRFLWSAKFLSCHLKFIWKLIISNRLSLNYKSYSFFFSVLILNNYPSKMRKYFHLWKLLEQMFLNFIIYSHTQLHTHTTVHFFPTVLSVENKL